MRVIPIILVIAAVAFTVYAVATQINATDPSKSPPARVWAAVVAAAASIGAAVSAYVSQWTQ